MISLLNFFKNPHPKDAQILEGVDIEETTAHMTTRIFIPVLSKYTSQELKSLKDLLIANSLWKIGTTNLINYMIKNKTTFDGMIIGDNNYPVVDVHDALVYIGTEYYN